MDALNDLDKLTTFLIKHDTESSDSESLEEIIEAPGDIQQIEYIQVDEIYVATNVDEKIAAASLQIDAKSSHTDEKTYSCKTIDTPAQSGGKTTGEFYDADEYTRNVINTCVDPLLRNALVANVKKRRLLATMYARCEAYLKQVAEYNGRNRAERISEHCQRHLCRSRLGMPYFKDRDRFPCPLNQDCLKPSRNDYSDYEPKVSWTANDKQKMAKAVYEEVRLKKLAELDKRILALSQQDEQAATKAEKVALVHAQTAFNDFKFVEQLALAWNANYTESCAKDPGSRDVPETPTKVKQLILETVASWTDIDWHRIACDDLKGRHSENECRTKWRCYMNPRFSKQRWTPVENERLCRLVHDHNYQDWDAIAGELGSTRSAYQCCVHYESTLNTSHKRKAWTKAEDALLVSTVASCTGASKRIPWSKVALYFTERTKVQLYNRYRFVADPHLRKGNFSIAEDGLLLVLARLHNADFGQMNVYFPGREINQIRARYTTITKHGDLLDWTVAEDAALVEHVSQYGERQWSKLQLQRNQHSCRHRYNVLRRWLQAHPDSTLEDVVRRKKNKRRQGRDRRKYILELVVDKVLEQLKHMPDRHERNRFLNVSTIQQHLRLMPDYRKLETRVPSVRPKRKACIVNQLLKTFFQCTYRHRGRSKIIRPEETAKESAETIALVLQLFRANLQLPSVEAIDSHPQLDAADRGILRQLLAKWAGVGEQAATNIRFTSAAERSPNAESDTSASGSSDKRTPTVIPPNPETLIGWRGLLLLYPTLLKHSKREYSVPTVDINTELKRLYTKIPIARARARMNRYLEDNGIDEQTRDAIATERLLFRHRFAQLFRWPCMMSELEFKHANSTVVADTNLPLAAGVPHDLAVTAAAVKLPAKRGRPRKKGNYKVDLMNKAKFLKRQADEPNSSKEAESTCAPRATSARGEPAKQTRTVTQQNRTSASCDGDKTNLVAKESSPVTKIRVYTNRKRKLDSDNNGLKANVAKRVTRSSTRNKSL